MPDRKHSRDTEGIQTTSATRSWSAQGKPSQLLQRQLGVRFDHEETRTLPLHALRMVHPSGARPPGPQMITFIEEHREVYRVEPICRVLLIAPSTYYAHAAVAHDPGKASDQSTMAAEILTTIRHVHDARKRRYGTLMRPLNNPALGDFQAG